jgi:hypothetical protein
MSVVSPSPPRIVVPIDIWRFIFQEYPDILLPADLYSVIRTSRFLCESALPQLLRRVIWTDPSHFIGSLSLWSASSGLFRFPRAVLIGISHCTTDQDLQLMDIEIQLQLSSADPDLRFPLSHSDQNARAFATRKIQSLIPRIVTKFFQLESLTFRRTVVPPAWHLVFPHLPGLRLLHIEECFIHEALDFFDHSMLQLYELTWLEVTQANVVSELARIPSSWDTIFRCASLVKLTIDASASAFLPRATHLCDMPLSKLGTFTVRGGTVPPLLTRDCEFGQQAAWILKSCTSLHTLDLHPDPGFDIEPHLFLIEPVLRDIVNFRGCLEQIPETAFAATRVKALDLVTELPLLTCRELWSFKNRFQNLEAMGINFMDGWEDDLVAHYIHHLSEMENLHRFQITYSGLPIDEVRFPCKFSTQIAANPTFSFQIDPTTAVLPFAKKLPPVSPGRMRSLQKWGAYEYADDSRDRVFIRGQSSWNSRGTASAWVQLEEDISRHLACWKRYA